jgi:SAM-dependent methyltransferase
MESISFDRASDYYDRTRSLSANATAQVTSLLTAELAGRGLTLEIGIGTGRIAVPLSEHGIEVCGVDLSRNMLDVLRAKSDRIPVALADATHLPFSDDAFDAALGCHVLHLIPDWRAALRELTRVVRPGGAVLIDLGGWGGGDWGLIEKRFVETAGIERARPGAGDPAEVDAEMASLGAPVRLLPPVAEVHTYSYADLVDRIEQGLYSYTWRTDPETRVRAARDLRPWVEAELGDLHARREHTWVVQWRAYDLPG